MVIGAGEGDRFFSESETAGKRGVTKKKLIKVHLKRKSQPNKYTRIRRDSTQEKDR